MPRKSDDGAAYDAALDRILDRTRRRGGLTVSIAAATAFVAAAKKSGIRKALGAARKKPEHYDGARVVDLETFAEVLDAEISPGPEPAPPAEEDPDAVRLAALTVPELKEVAAQLGVEDAESASSKEWLLEQISTKRQEQAAAAAEKKAKAGAGASE